MSIDSRPRVLLVVRAIVVDKGKILLIKRSSKDSSGAGIWEIPGGKIDSGDEINVAIEREVLEETGLIIRLIDPGMFVDSSMLTSGKYSGLAYITLVGLSNLSSGEVSLSEEHEGACWVDVNGALKMNISFITRKALIYFKDRL
jgi:8-oxo-dGTP diphosphatase